ncbi:MAG: hypothetical protein PHC61_19235, partial [Chitinivibrionales bacterium]|nr:hypothetical protein [Chitinivibrionales bacterium]
HQIASEAILESSSYYNGNIGTFKWKIPAVYNDPAHLEVNMVSDSCKIEVEAPYEQYTSPRDFSDNVFSIKP